MKFKYREFGDVVQAFQVTQEMIPLFDWADPCVPVKDCNVMASEGDWIVDLIEGV